MKSTFESGKCLRIMLQCMIAAKSAMTSTFLKEFICLKILFRWFSGFANKHKGLSKQGWIQEFAPKNKPSSYSQAGSLTSFSRHLRLQLFKKFR